MYYNCVIKEWTRRGYANSLPLETVDEKELERQGIPPFITNKVCLPLSQTPSIETK